MNKLVIGLVAGLTVFGSVFAMAATLGLGADDLGAGDEVVQACDTDVSVDFTFQYDATTNGLTPGVTGTYIVKEVLFALDARCNTQSGEVTLTDTAGAVLGASAPFTAASGLNTVAFGTGNKIAAEKVTEVHIVITGNGPNSNP